MNPRTQQILTYCILGIFALAALYPIVALLTIALHHPQELATGIGFPTEISLESFRRAWVEGAFGSALISSAVVAGAVAVLVTGLSMLPAFAFGTMQFRGSTVIFYFLLLGTIVPYEATIVPLYFEFRALGLTESYWSLILPQIGLLVSFGTFWLRAYFLTVPRSLIEAAEIDGASSLRVLVRVLLPGARPALLTLLMLTFMYAWNEFLLAVVMVQGAGHRTAPAALAFFSNSARHTNLSVVAAAAFLVMAPIIIVYIALQRQFIRGMMAGAVKG